MTTKKLVLVSGANGHLGNNLVRLLLSRGFQVRASVRNLDNSAALQDLPCELVAADITDKASFTRALQGVDTFYAVGAAFKLWARDPQKEIYDVNMQGTRNTIEAAAAAGVKKIIYVSSIAALDYTHTPTRESNGYNPDRRDAYYNSKNDGEKLAFQLARELGIELVSVMPGAMIGSEAALPLNVSYDVLRLILTRQIPVDTGISLNWVDVKDVAEGCYLAALHGKPGERYILANEKCMSISDTTRLAQKLYPQLQLKIPAAVPKIVLYTIAGLMQFAARLQGKAPVITTKDIAMFSGLQQDFNISKARTELGFNPKSSEEAVREALAYLMEHQELL
ncbi:NAD-dependent epimerase/dehydratase family protein [Sphingobacterium paramultivorum]|uniref:NAD-dependent epimerase/dehydratase family protein n=1 Tax=Sphingobacterium paramultivorum TaxID=2886510 RepID=A0A7G5DZR7_9SPHI|nr:NAD-dependent epimerase/dehydratase family protein [Sphingobacterium paramultivorum]QMV67242.1 NAD-dependent epimerase/dehydratase family protein [Sphingobacterium paramultivorum]WSO16095.1 NAD-dependent epimerase/dehydratase family protein [Sphingobacterium paramultivorum]